ncbi:MAG: cyclic nucleotide-binding domain-containing protein [Hyphomicrobiales bacterium]
MNVAAPTMNRPHRWDVPFDSGMTDADIESLKATPEIANVKSELFPAHIPLHGILKNDARIVSYQPGDIVCREGDYGNSAFLILTGTVRVVLSHLPRELLGRQATQKKGLFQSISQLWTNTKVREVRDTERYRNVRTQSRGKSGETHIYLQDAPAVLDQHRTVTLPAGQLFGELAALGRVPRSATIIAATETRLLEIRWQGLRELRRYDPGWKRHIDENYRRNALHAVLQANPLFAGLTEADLKAVADQVKLRTYGSFDWHVSYKEMREKGNSDDEPMIAAEGLAPDGIYLVRAGFARVSVKYGSAQRTLAYLGAGDEFGLEEAYQAWITRKPVPRRNSLTGLGYVDVLRVPSSVLEKYVFPHLRAPAPPPAPVDRPVHDDAFAEWLVDERLINGTQTMLIDLDRCVRCDDCVKACASTHGGNPRFIRHGRAFDHWMVANACMHCRDPVCMIGCPTGAIHRHESAGVVVINDDTCIGCGTCANSCPYDNIRLVEIANPSGTPIVDDEGRAIVKATKCDLCVEQLGGPACARACPHDALRRVNVSTLIEHEATTTWRGANESP